MTPGGPAPQDGATEGDPGEPQAVTLYEFVGGEPFFRALVDRFYDGVADDPVLRPLYPEAELDGARARLTGFLVQYWGGPDDYSRARGHPRLRLRHAPFPVGEAERDRWLVHMGAATEAVATEPEVRRLLWEYFVRAADAMVNQPR